MADRRRIEERIRKKESEIQVLEAQVKDARVYIQALQDVLKMFPKDADESPEAGSILRPRSLVAQARDAILKRGIPLHIDQILKDIGKPLDRTNKTTLSGSLSAYVRKGEIFIRPAPNTFGLKELHEKELVSEEPPPEFGSDVTRAIDDKDDIQF